MSNPSPLRPPLSILELVPVGEGDDRGGGARGLGRARPARGASRLHPPLGRRASQHARHREYVAARTHRAPGRVDQHDAHRRGRCDAAEPRRARCRGAVRDARGAASRPHRSRTRTRARHRPDHRGRVAPEPRDLRGRRVSRAVARPLHVLRRLASADHGRARTRLPTRGVVARIERLQRAGCGCPRASVFVRAPLRVAQHSCRARAVPELVPALAGARPSVRDDRRAGHLCRHVGARQVALRSERALVRAAAAGTPDAVAHTRGRGGVRVHTVGARARAHVDRSAHSRRCRRGDRGARSAGRSAPAPTS